VCTPFVPDRTGRAYSRFVHTAKGWKRVVVEAKGNRPHVRGNESAVHATLGRRTPNRRAVLSYLAVNSETSDAFSAFVRRCVVVPTFSSSVHEALVKVIIRQLISAVQAKNLYSSFVQTYGYEREGVFGFPTPGSVAELPAAQLRGLRFGFKSERIIAAVQVLLDEGDDAVWSVSGVGPWSREVLQVEVHRDYAYYPFWDLSGQRIAEVCGIDVAAVAATDKQLAGDLYVYGAAYLESLRTARLTPDSPPPRTKDSRRRSHDAVRCLTSS
jgi:3-methyladenine DNA glycosylase/8-oxoguanine DNA glycosylase